MEVRENPYNEGDRGHGLKIAWPSLSVARHMNWLGYGRTRVVTVLIRIATGSGTLTFRKIIPVN